MIGWRTSAGVEKPCLVCEHDRLDAVAEAELLEDVRDVRLDGRVTDVELLPDLGVRQAAGDQPEHVEFALSQLVESLGRRGLRNPGELPDHAFGYGRRQQRVSGGDGADRGEELFGGI